jgi:hypothetical protein
VTLTTAPPLPSTSSPAIRGDARVLSVASSYREAQATVNRLSGAGFPVKHVRIIGDDLHSVEQVTGQLTMGRATLVGTVAGAWLGILVGLLIGLLVPGLVFGWVLVTSFTLAAAWGAFFGFVAHWRLHGERDFTSTQRLVAAQYEVMVDSRHAARAADLLSK